MVEDAVTVARLARSADELALLAAIADRPDEDLRRLVYADWLEERGDPRGGLLRRCVKAARAGAELPSLDGLPPGWADLTGLTWTRDLTRAGLTHRREALLAVARVALRLDAGEPAFDDPPPTPAALGTTRLGGDPDLPASDPYPTVAAGVPLYFLGQFDLTDLRGTVAGRALPDAGLLSIFRPQEEWGSCYPTPADCPWLVRVTPPGAPLARLPRPAVTIKGEYTPALAPFRPGLRLVETLRLPGNPGRWPGVELTDEEVDRLDAVAPTNLGGEVYLLLGHVTHGNTGEEPLAGRPGWVQLVLVPPSEGPDFGQSDMSLSYQLPAADLKAGRLDRLEATFG
jgi:uncharacterized protein (TIGR02996 family)